MNKTNVFFKIAVKDNDLILITNKHPGGANFVYDYIELSTGDSYDAAQLENIVIIERGTYVDGMYKLILENIDTLISIKEDFMINKKVYLEYNDFLSSFLKLPYKYSFKDNKLYTNDCILNLSAIPTVEIKELYMNITVNGIVRPFLINEEIINKLI